MIVSENSSPLFRIMLEVADQIAAPFRESRNNIARGTSGVRVQTVNIDLVVQKLEPRCFRFAENESTFFGMRWGSGRTGRAESAGAARGRRNRGHGYELGPRDRRDHHLRDTFAAPDRKRRSAVIDQQDRNLAAVIRINR